MMEEERPIRVGWREKGGLGSRDRMWTIVKDTKGASLSLSPRLFHLHLYVPAQIHPPAYHSIRWLLGSLRENQICPAQPWWPAPRLDPGVTLARERQSVWPSSCHNFVYLPHSRRHHGADCSSWHSFPEALPTVFCRCCCDGLFYGKCYV